MGISINGYIARQNGDVKWNSPEGWKSFYDHGKQAGNYIMGANTYLAAVADGDFPFAGVLNIVMVHQEIEKEWGPQVIFTKKTPREVLAEVEQKGFETALVIGGGKLNSSFASENLIDEVYIDIEPTAFGKGVPLFEGSDFEMNLRLIETKQLSSNTIQLHYQVIK